MLVVLSLTKIYCDAHLKMTFYMKLPKGVINLHILEECVAERLLCYKNLKNGALEVSQFQYLVEDSCLDRTGHFMLRLLACSNRTFRYDFINNETKLLEARLNAYDRQDMKQFLKRLLKHSREVSNNKNESLRKIYSVFIRVFSIMLRKDYLNHWYQSEHINNQGCEVFTIKVPFTTCLSLISKREVEVNKGSAQITCSLWKQFLLSSFETYLNIVLNSLKYSNHVNFSLQDVRISNILKFVKDYNSDNNLNIPKHNNVTLNITNIFQESTFFPLCMMNLFQVLQKTNRLAHNERFDFSLYLKSIGMSMSDSLKFWEQLYSKEHSSCSRCTHSWQKNEKRYIYGIRHLYGMEGSRKDYQCRSCAYLQENTLGPRENGGCPFKQFDDNNLRNILKDVLPTKPNEIQIMIYERKRNPNMACRIFLETVYNIKTNETLNHPLLFNSPVNYYSQLKRELERH